MRCLIFAVATCATSWPYQRPVEVAEHPGSGIRGTCCQTPLRNFAPKERSGDPGRNRDAGITGNNSLLRVNFPLEIRGSAEQLKEAAEAINAAGSGQTYAESTCMLAARSRPTPQVSPYGSLPLPWLSSANSSSYGSACAAMFCCQRFRDRAIAARRYTRRIPIVNVSETLFLALIHASLFCNTGNLHGQRRSRVKKVVGQDVYIG